MRKKQNREKQFSMDFYSIDINTLLRRASFVNFEMN